VSATISQAALRELVAGWIAQGKRVAGPRLVFSDVGAVRPSTLLRAVSDSRTGDPLPEGFGPQGEPPLLYAPLESAAQLALEGFIRPANSVKEFIFPKHEELYGYRITGNRIDLIEAEQPAGEQVVIAARPCDAASLPILDHVFNWDYKDELYNLRRQLTTIVTLACAAHDDACFCTSVGLGPAAERGSDAMLLELDDGEYEVRCLTEKGKALFDGKLQASERRANFAVGPEKRFDAQQARAFLNEHFDSPFWPAQTLACLGCGACAYTCPTCHCFDFVDEGNIERGVRARNWDSCQFAMFTLHASGHNPRPDQPARQRQRMDHKFRVYPEKFGEILCTGCGNCARNCPVGMGVLRVLGDIDHALSCGAEL
jgi:ferredoxin